MALCLHEWVSWSGECKHKRSKGHITICSSVMWACTHCYIHQRLHMQTISITTHDTHTQWWYVPTSSGALYLLLARVLTTRSNPMGLFFFLPSPNTPCREREEDQWAWTHSCWDHNCHSSLAQCERWRSYCYASCSQPPTAILGVLPFKILLVTLSNQHSNKLLSLSEWQWKHSCGNTTSNRGGTFGCCCTT